MPVYEIKNPVPLPKQPAPKKKDIDEVDTTSPVTRIAYYKKAWKRKAWSKEGGKNSATGEKEDGTEHNPPPGYELAVRTLVDQVNENLEKEDRDIHLVLIRDDTGYVLEVYDCSESTVCRVIDGVTVSFDDLPQLIRNLQEEAGILLDTVS